MAVIFANGLDVGSGPQAVQNGEDFLLAHPMPLDENGDPLYATVILWVEAMGRNLIRQSVKKGRAMRIKQGYAPIDDPTEIVIL